MEITLAQFQTSDTMQTAVYYALDIAVVVGSMVFLYYIGIILERA